jgi:DNA-binding NarL/FixJ family response regulator
MAELETDAGRVRIMLVDDNQQFLTSVQRFLSNEHLIDVVGVSVTGQDFWAQVNILCPHLVLMDIALPDANGLELTRQLRRVADAPRVIVMTVYEQSVYGEAAVEAGADGFVTKDAFGLSLLPLIRTLFNKQKPMIF